MPYSATLLKKSNIFGRYTLARYSQCASILINYKILVRIGNPIVWIWYAEDYTGVLLSKIIFCVNRDLIIKINCALRVAL